MKRTLATLFLIVSSVNIYGMKKKIKKFINKVLNTSEQSKDQPKKLASKLLDKSTVDTFNLCDKIKRKNKASSYAVTLNEIRKRNNESHDES